MKPIKCGWRSIFSQVELNSNLAHLCRYSLFQKQGCSVNKAIFFQGGFSIFQLKTRPVTSSHNYFLSWLSKDLTYFKFKIIETGSRICGEIVGLRRFYVVKFNSDSIDLIFKLFWPIEIFWVRLDKQNLSLKDTHLFNIFLVVVRKVDDLMIKIFIILMSLYDANWGILTIFTS